MKIESYQRCDLLQVVFQFNVILHVYVIYTIDVTKTEWECYIFFSHC
jgi:hypothetical protein